MSAEEEGIQIIVVFYVRTMEHKKIQFCPTWKASNTIPLLNVWGPRATAIVPTRAYLHVGKQTRVLAFTPPWQT